MQLYGTYVPMSVLRIRIRIPIRINLQTTSQNLWNMSLFEHFFQVLSLYLKARTRIQIRIKVNGRTRIRVKLSSRIRIRITVTSRIRIRIRINVMQTDPQH